MMENRYKWDETYKHFTFRFRRQTPERYDVDIFRTKDPNHICSSLSRITYETAIARAEFEAEVLIRAEKGTLRRKVKELERS